MFISFSVSQSVKSVSRVESKMKLNYSGLGVVVVVSHFSQKYI